MKELILTTKQVKQIYDDFKGKKLNLDEMLKKYCVDTSDYVVYVCDIEFRRGDDYYKEGLITQKEYEKINKLLESGHEISLGEVNGPHSEVIANKNDFTFYEGKVEDEKDRVDRYISKNGKNTYFRYDDNWCQCEDLKCDFCYK